MRSFWHLLGSPRQEVAEAQEKVDLARVEFEQMTLQIKSVQDPFTKWQGPEKRYIACSKRAQTIER